MQGRRGIALFNVLMFMSITTIMLVAGIQFTQASLKEGRTANLDQQVYQVALSGLNHAVMWLQMHRTEVPIYFDPRVVPTEPDFPAETTVADEQLGLVKEYQVDASSKLWGRYEVGRSKAAPARGSLNMGPESPLYATAPSWTVEDVGLARGGSAGSVWRARCRAYLYRRPTGSEAFGLTPAPPAATTVEGEIKNLSFKIPRAAIYSFKNGADTGTPHVAVSYTGTANAGNTEISNGGETGALHVWSHTPSSKIARAANVIWSGSGLYSEAAGCTVDGTSLYVDPNLTNQLTNVFGVSNADGIEGMSDLSYTAVADVPSPVSGSKFIYLNPGGTRGTATFDATNRLRGSGVLFVDGSLVIEGTSAASHYWNGLIFVTGHYNQKGNSAITGAVMAGQSVIVGGADGSKAKILYSQDQLNRVAETFSGYRIDRATLKVLGVKNTSY